MEEKSAGASVGTSPFITTEEQKEKRVLTVGYVVSQTIRMIAQMIVQARISSFGSGDEYSGQWVGLNWWWCCQN